MNDDVSRILALAPNWLGDAAMCTPALRALHRRFPNAELTVAGNAGVCELLRGLPWIARLQPFPARAGPATLLDVARQVRPRARDLAIVFPHSFRAALLAWLARSRRRVGYARGGRSWLLTDRVAPHSENGQIVPRYMGLEYLDLLAGLGGSDDGLGLELCADADAATVVRGRFTGTGPRVGIAPGAAFGPSKRWPAERFAAVADALRDRIGAQCVLLTGPGEDAIRDAVVSATNMPLIRCDDGPPSIRMLKAVISQLDLLVCNDSGPRHVAVAFKVPTVCVLGPTSPSYSEGPYERGRVLRVDVDCGPCQKPECETDHRCMTRIDANQAINAAVDVLATEKRPER